jgi:hypothetical protein
MPDADARVDRGHAHETAQQQACGLDFAGECALKIE